jgi:SAM-dependent MidA family methyltransferase
MEPWSSAMAEALYGRSGFYRSHQPQDHFRTSASSTPLFATALGRLVTRVDHALGHPDHFDLVDVGAGDGSLLTNILATLPPRLTHRVRPVAVEIRARPSALPNEIDWMSDVPAGISGLVMAHELLDNIPCDVIERVSGSPHLVLVSREGEESKGPVVDQHRRAWLDAWWPMTADGDRAEFGGRRDQCWAGVVASVDRGLALAVDYGHVREERVDGAYGAGTLTGYRHGYRVLPIPDGASDITAHVAVDACEAAGLAAGAQFTSRLRQRRALQLLGISSTLPDRELASANPAEYMNQLSLASSAAELIDPSSLGSFWWLLQSKGMAVPIGSDALSG